MSITRRFCFTCFIPVILIKMATGLGGQLTNDQKVRLARAISIRNMESIALGYLGFEEETIKNRKYENKDNAEAFNRDVINTWLNMNSGINQCEVSWQKGTLTYHLQWRIQDFPEGVRQFPNWDYFAIFLPKTA